MTNALQPSPSALEGLVTVPRTALQAMAEWAYPMFAHDRIRAKLPAQHPRWTSWNIHDDLQVQLERERMAFLKDLFWKAEQEANRRERAMDPSRELGLTPSLEAFMECVAEMDDHNWDEQLAPKDLAERKRKIKAKKAERAKWKDEREHPSPESITSTMTTLGNTSLFVIRENLASADPEIRAKALEEIPRLMGALGKLMDSAQAVA